MSKFPFIEARFFAPEETLYELEDRFRQHLRKLRSRGMAPVEFSGATNDARVQERISQIQLSNTDRQRINHRVQLILERRQIASGMGHLRREDQERLTALRGGAELIEIPSEHRADELAAELHEEMPWMAAATEMVWHAMRRSVREGWAGLRLPPLLLDGPPGIGKSHWARRLGGLISAPVTVVEATGENASFGIVGAQRGWSRAHPGRLLETIMQTRIGNPVVVVDEVEKAGTAVSTQGHIFGLAEALLPLLEPMSAKRWSCPYYQVKFDMSWVAWVLTSNNYQRLPEPLLSRCPPVRLRELTTEELVGFVNREGAKRDLSDASVGAICEALQRMFDCGGSPSLRVASRLLQRAADLENQPIRH